MQEKNQSVSNDNALPIQTEGVYTDLEVTQGQIPAELNGVLYRNGPNPRFPQKDAHLFEGDGMIHAITLANGNASYQNRWVRTNKFKLEQQEGRALFANFDMNNDPIAEGVSGDTANTNIISHANRLLALQETAPTVEIKKSDLDTIGVCDFAGKVPSLSAHPHLDYLSGEMLWHDYTPMTNDVHFYIFDKKGDLTKSELITAPYSSFMHDFMFSKNFVIFPVMPLTFSMERAQSGKPMLMFDSSLDTHMGIMPRDGNASDIVWFQLPPFYVYHFMNAYEKDGTLILDGLKSDRAPLFPDENGEVASGATHPRNLVRWTFNLETHQVQVTMLNDKYDMEFPRLDERYMGQAYTHGFAATKSDPNIQIFDSLVYLNLMNNTSTLRHLGDNNGVSEPVFVPRSPNAVEGDGYLLAVVFNHMRNSSDLLILDAMDINGEPVATVAMPHRIPYGFHGNWVSTHYGKSDAKKL